MEFNETNMVALDELVEKLRASEPKDGIVVNALNVNRFESFRFTVSLLEALTKGHDVKIDYVIDKPFSGMGVITLETKESIIFPNTEWFARAAEFANNVNVYPLTNGNIKMDFTFYGVTKKIN